MQGNRRKAKKKEAEPLADRIKVFSFDSLNTLIALTGQIDCDYRGKNSLWKDPATKRISCYSTAAKEKMLSA